MQSNLITPLPATHTHPGGLFWLNELIQAAQHGLGGWDVIKPCLPRIKVSEMNAADKRKWKVGDIMSGPIPNSDDEMFLIVPDNEL